jgi:predicted metal-dependent peptidase
MIFSRDDNNILEAYTSVLNSRYKKYRFLKEQKEIEYDSIDEELFKELDLRLSRARFYLQKEHPFYWRILTNLKTVMTYEVPTMAVDDLGNIYINPKFAVNVLDQDGVTAVLVHEAGHVVGLTFFRKKSRDHYLWNVATDYIINRDLLEDGFKLPDYPNFKALLPIKSGDRWIIPKYDNVDITDFTAEKMYSFLKKWQEKEPDKVEEDIEDSENFDQPIDPDQPEPETGEEQEIKIGDIIRDTETNQYGRVTAIDKASGEIDIDPMTKEEVKKHFDKPDIV